MIEKLKKQLISGDIKEVLNSLKKLDGELSLDIHKEISLVESKYEKIKRDSRNGIISHVDENIEFQRILSSILDIINSEIDTQINNQISAGDNSLELKLKSEKLIYNIDKHLRYIKGWSESVQLVDSGQRRSLRSTYVKLDYYATLRKYHLDRENRIEVSILELIRRNEGHIFLFGQPGAGKTTTDKKVIQDFFKKNDRVPFNFPIVIRLRELEVVDEQYNLIPEVLSLVGVDIESNYKSNLINNTNSVEGVLNDFSQRSVAQNIKVDILIRNIRKSIKKYSEYYTDKEGDLYELAAIDLIDSMKCLLILDGFDEVALAEKEVIAKEVQRLCYGLHESKILITSRLGDTYFNIQNASNYEICELSDDQIHNFISKWLNETPDIVNKAFVEIKNTPYYDSMKKPLTISYLCAIYQRYNRIPEQPKYIYQRILYILTEEWDAIRKIQRDSAFSAFSIERKNDFLSSLAYELSTKGNRTSFSRRDLKGVYLDIYENFRLPKSDLENVLNELESHTGLFIKSGPDKYEFSHKSIQEYLCAEHIIRLSKLPAQEILIKVPSECALLVAMSSSPEDYLSQLKNERINYMKKDYNFASFFYEFFNRLILEKPNLLFEDLMIISLLNIYTQCVYFNLDLDYEVKKLLTHKDFRNQLNNLFEVSEKVNFNRIEKFGEYENIATTYSMGNIEFYNFSKKNTDDNFHIRKIDYTKINKKVSTQNNPQYVLFSKQWLKL